MLLSTYNCAYCICELKFYECDKHGERESERIMLTPAFCVQANETESERNLLLDAVNIYILLLKNDGSLT